MLKNKYIKLASILLMLCLITTCGVCGTFAKYTTGGTATDSARVAKWGVNVTVDGDNAFKAAYNSTVASVDGTTKVVAPGTGNDLVNVTITGTPEVAVAITYEPSLTLTGWTDGANEYCPIIFTVGDDTYGMTGMRDSNGDLADYQYSSVDNLIDGVINAIEAKNGEYAPGTSLDGKANISTSWDWAFTGNSDINDTILGTAEISPSIEFSLIVSVTQID